MSYILPLFAAVLQAASLTVDKTVLSFRHVSYKVYTGVSFPLLIVIGLFAFVIVRPGFNPAVLVNHNLLFLLLSAAIAVGSNLFYYRALKEDSLGEIQTWTLLAAFPTIMLAGAIFADERHPAVIFAAIIAGAAVAWSHWRRHHFRIAKKTAAFVFWALAIYPFGSLLNKELLAVWHPVSLELVRDAAVALVLVPLFWRQSVKVPAKAFRLLVVTNILTAGAFILQGYSVQRSGVIFTGLVYSLQPLLAYFSSVAFLKEKFDWKKAAAFGVVLASILAVRLIG
jgi:drug/metabolite transporter (DMT)-like permease